MKKKSCWSTYYELNLTTKGFLSSCCVQDLEIEVDWSKIDDLDEWFRTNKHLKRTRKKLDKGIRIPSCEGCWHQERNNFVSRRKLKNLNQSFSDEPTIKFLDLRLGNKCNLQCKMCTISDTDQLVKLGEELHEKGITDILYDPTMYVKDIPKTKVLDLALKLPNLKKIRFAGGEPFLMPEVELFLKKLVEIKKTDLNIEFITNCTAIKDKTLDLLSNFKYIQLSCSIDAVDDQLEYQRYPAKWDTIKRNFEKIYNRKSDNFEVGLTPCVGMLNLTKIHKFVEWCNQYPDVTCIFNEIDTPTYQNFRYVPMEDRKELIEASKNLKLINGDANWEKFFKKMIYQYKTPTLKECQLLKHYSEKVWDYRCNVKFLDAYPWAKYMIDMANE